MTRARPDLHRPVLALALALALCAVASVLTLRVGLNAWRRRIPLDATMPYDNTVMVDFRDTGYFPNLAVAAGVNPYDVPAYHQKFPGIQDLNAYAPWWLTVTRPLSELSWAQASALFALVTTLATTALMAHQGWLLARRTGFLSTSGAGSTTSYAVIGAAATVVLTWLSKPYSIALGLGNISMVACAAASLALVTRSVPLGAACVGLAWVKPQLGLPLVLFLAVLGRGRPALVGTLLAATASLPEIVMLSRGRGLLDLARSVLAGAGDVAGDQSAVLMQGRLDVAGMGSVVGLNAPSWVIAAAAIILLPAAALLVRRQDAQGQWVAARVTASIAMLVTVPHYSYDIAVCLVPFGLLALHAWPGRGGGATSWSRRPAPLAVYGAFVALGAATFFMPGVVFVHPPHQTAFMRATFWLCALSALTLVAYRARRSSEDVKAPSRA